ncbi:hypothetical protein HDU91_003714 [Kappamyces sp. JEL0680]|nr:hypothetical protein HDU91_003714 [Kappamyces sp. JEL0680]
MGTTPYGFTAALVANRIDQPGRRVILQEDAVKFARQHRLDYYECSPSDDADSIHEMFYKIVSQVVAQIPEGMGRRQRISGAVSGVCPIGLQLGLALDPVAKYKYKQRLKTELLLPTTSEVDWLSQRLDSSLAM